MKARELFHPACAWLGARQLWLAVLLGAAVLIPRSIIITAAHSPSEDDENHLRRGLMYLHRDLTPMLDIMVSDPPLGEAMCAFPAWLNRIEPDGPLDVPGGNPNGQSFPPHYGLSDTVAIETAIWKSLLFLPAIAVIFHWVRSIYSTASAWLAVAIVLTEPTIVAHMPIPALDVLGMEAILIAVWIIWRFIQNPSAARACQAGFFTAVALLVKNTALVLPGVAVLLLAVHLWHTRPVVWRRYLRLGLLAVAVVPVSIWLLLLCEVDHGVPAAVYVHSFLSAIWHVHHGQYGYLLGKISTLGWWYYFPVVATYKIPLGILGLMVLALLVFCRVDAKGVFRSWILPRYAETPLFIAAMVWTAALMVQTLNIGFRHFLPAEIFFLLLASRCLASGGRTIAIVAWGLLAWSAIDVMRWTPDELSYTNSLHATPYLDISHTNLDWGQGLKELHRWIDALPNDGRPVYYGYYGPADENVYDVLGPRLTEYSYSGEWQLPPESAHADRVTGQIPTHGILVLSPTVLTGQFDDDRFKAMRTVRPDYLIGHCLLVYDLDALRARGDVWWLTPIGPHGPR